MYLRYNFGGLHEVRLFAVDVQSAHGFRAGVATYSGNGFVHKPSRIPVCLSADAHNGDCSCSGRDRHDQECARRGSHQRETSVTAESCATKRRIHLRMQRNQRKEHRLV